MEELSSEVLLHIFSYVSLTDRLKVLQFVSKRFQSLVWDKTLLQDINFDENSYFTTIEERNILKVAKKHVEKLYIKKILDKAKCGVTSKFIQNCVKITNLNIVKIPLEYGDFIKVIESLKFIKVLHVSAFTIIPPKLKGIKGKIKLNLDELGINCISHTCTHVSLNTALESFEKSFIQCWKQTELSVTLRPPRKMETFVFDLEPKSLILNYLCYNGINYGGIHILYFLQFFDIVNIPEALKLKKFKINIYQDDCFLKIMETKSIISEETEILKNIDHFNFILSRFVKQYSSLRSFPSQLIHDSERYLKPNGLTAHKNFDPENLLLINSDPSVIEQLSFSKHFIPQLKRLTKLKYLQISDAPSVVPEIISLGEFHQTLRVLYFSLRALSRKINHSKCIFTDSVLASPPKKRRALNSTQVKCCILWDAFTKWSHLTTLVIYGGNDMTTTLYSHDLESISLLKHLKELNLIELYSIREFKFLEIIMNNCKDINFFKLILLGTPGHCQYQSILIKHISKLRTLEEITVTHSHLNITDKLLLAFTDNKFLKSVELNGINGTLIWENFKTAFEKLLYKLKYLKRIKMMSPDISETQSNKLLQISKKYQIEIIIFRQQLNSHTVASSESDENNPLSKKIKFVSDKNETIFFV